MKIATTSTSGDYVRIKQDGKMKSMWHRTWHKASAQKMEAVAIGIFFVSEREFISEALRLHRRAAF